MFLSDFAKVFDGSTSFFFLIKLDTFEGQGRGRRERVPLLTRGKESDFSV